METMSHRIADGLRERNKVITGEIQFTLLSMETQNLLQYGVMNMVLIRALHMADIKEVGNQKIYL